MFKTEQKRNIGCFCSAVVAAMEMDNFRKASHRCLVTYGASGASIIHNMFDENKKIQVDECYTLSQRDLKYTLLHSTSRITRSIVSSILCRFDEKYSIKLAGVFGYHAISIGDEIDEHPGMSLIAGELNKTPTSLQSWMAFGTIKENKRGLLFPYLTDIQMEKMTRAQLVNYTQGLKSEVSEVKTKMVEMESHLLRLERENRGLKMRIETQRYMLEKARQSTDEAI